MTERRRRREIIRRRRQRRRARQQHSAVPAWVWGPIGLVVVLIAVVGVGAGAAYSVYRSFADDLVEPEAILETQRALGTSKVFDRGGANGTLLFEFADPLSGLRNPVRLQDVSEYLINATVATEDASFWENSGINIRGLARAAWENLNLGLGSGDFLGGSGGSSITQQLVKNVLIPPEERTGRTRERVEAKLKESILAIELTEKYPKQQILEWYLNSIFYGNLSYGIGAASGRYFGKPTSELTLPEAALLAGVPQAPAIFDPFTNPLAAKERQAQVLDLMVPRYISQAEADRAKREPLNFASRSFDIQAPHFVLFVREQVAALCDRGRIPLPDTVQDCSELLTDGGLRITTTLDMDLQRQAEEILSADLATFEEQTGAHNAALVSLDPKTGQILVMVGSRDFFREDIDGQVNLATSLNSPGSSIKPITYVAAFLQDPKLWNPATIIWDVPIKFEEADGTIFSPENFDAVHRGPVTIRTALANSINIAAFRVAATLGTATVLEVAHQLGITTMRDLNNYGPSITLGGGDVTLLDMVFAYSVFANNGLMRGKRSTLDLPPGYRELDPISILEIRDSRGRLLFQQEGAEEARVIPAPQAFQITDILSDNQARAILYGLNSNLVLDRPVAAKTGTAGEPGRNDVRRDYWTMGYTPDLVTGVWVGNADNTPMTGGSSSRTAGLIWRDFMLAAHEGIPPSAFVVPEGLTTAEVFIPQLRTLKRGEDRKELKPQNPCSTLRLELFVAQAGVPDKDNGICSRVKVDARTLLLASDETPEQYVRDGFFLIPPIAEGAEEPDAAIINWLRLNKVRYVGDEESTEAALTVRIDTPPDGAELQSDFVLIRGRASSDEFESWTLSFAAGENPSDEDFIELFHREDSTASGQLTRWDVRGLPPGPYVLRLVVADGFLGEVIVESRITIVREEEETEIMPVETDAGVSEEEEEEASDDSSGVG
ncbi:MAG: transglycosylase domain-containing protein [Dehalococcoidia bacterium]